MRAKRRQQQQQQQQQKTKIKKFEELWSKIRMKNSNVKLSLNKTVEIPSMIIVARAVFHENNKYCLQGFLDE